MIKSQHDNSALQAVELIGFPNRIRLKRFHLDFAEGKINERQNEKRKTDPDMLILDTGFSHSLPTHLTSNIRHITFVLKQLKHQS